MWVKAELNDDGIELFWQVRTAVIDGNLCCYDANGNLDSSAPRHRAVYPEPMRSAGIIPVDDSFVEFCGQDRFDDFVYAIMRHSANMIARGYGEDPEQVVSWYSNIRELEFLEDVSFKIVDSVEPFSDMNGLKCKVSMNDENILVACIMVNDDFFEVPMDDDNILISFIISSVPF